MKPKQLREQTDAELRSLLEEQSTLLNQLRYNHTITALENPARIRKVRKEIAVIKTLQHERFNATLKVVREEAAKVLGKTMKKEAPAASSAPAEAGKAKAGMPAKAEKAKAGKTAKAAKASKAAK